MGVDAISYFRTDEHVVILKGLLQDPEASVVEVAGRGDDDRFKNSPPTLSARRHMPSSRHGARTSPLSLPVCP